MLYGNQKYCLCLNCSSVEFLNVHEKRQKYHHTYVYCKLTCGEGEKVHSLGMSR